MPSTRSGAARLSDLSALHDRHARFPQFLHRAGDVARPQLDAAASIGDEKGAKAELASVERGELDAVVGGETEHVHVAGATPLQIVCEAGRLAVPVVEDAAVAIDGRIRPFAEDR